MGLVQHSPRPRTGVEDAHAGLRLNDLHHRPDNFRRRVELAGFLTGGVSEVLD